MIKINWTVQKKFLSARGWLYFILPGLIIFFVTLFHPALLQANCFAVVVGQKASVDGSVLVGHNEQNGGRRIINYRYVPRLKFPPGTKIKLKNGGSLEEVPETYAFIWQENPGAEFGDSYFNEWGVVIVSDACPSREDAYDELVKRGEIREGGIGYLLRRLVAQRARTAREGVKIAGDLIERFGYTSMGRTYVIADPHEAWLLAVVRGRHWIAERCPDDGVVLLPNLYIIGQEADLQDKNNVLSSPGLVDYARRRGWYDPSSGRPFSFKDVFTPPPRKNSFREKYGVDPRQWYAQSLVLGQFIDLPRTSRLPFAVKPKHKLSVQDVMNILRSHGENSPFDQNKNYSQGSPHLNRNPGTIRSKSTQEGAVYQLRSWLPREVGCLVWRTTAAPCTGVFTPWYLGITATPPEFYKPVPLEKALSVDHHFNYPEELLLFDEDFAFDVFNELENLVERDYKRAIRIVRQVWAPMEKEQFDLQHQIEAQALALLKQNPAGARKFLTNYTHQQALMALKKAKKLIRELKTKFWGY
ncbi:C69 family dipeptidase [Candidatus Aminicenantes bacterium AC-334-K16]|jgi:dipeptidase|nr:C69 family dipeptidase [Candidatus Aminicenantes bacterium AC-334-K16]